MTMDTAISTGAGHTCALLLIGTVNCWGDGSSDQLGGVANSNRLPPTAGRRKVGARELAPLIRIENLRRADLQRLVECLSTKERLQTV